MAGTIGFIVVDPQGNSLAVTFTNDAGIHPTVYSDAAGTSSVSLPDTISSRKTYYFASPMNVAVSAKSNGIEVANNNGGTVPVYVAPGTGATVTVSLDPAESVSLSNAAGLLAANNLSELTSAATARTNLGLGTAAVQNVGAFAQVANNLSDVTAATARTNLGLGTVATHAYTDPFYGLDRYLMPTGAVAVPYDERFIGSASQTLAASGSMFCEAFPLLAGTVCANVTFFAGGTSGTNCTHSWAMLMDSTLTAVAVTADVTTATWTQSTTRTFSFTNGTGTYTVPTSGMYYMGLVFTHSGGATPTLCGVNGTTNTAVGALTPTRRGTPASGNGTGLTTPVSVGYQVATLTYSNQSVYFYVS